MAGMITPAIEMLEYGGSTHPMASYSSLLNSQGIDHACYHDVKSTLEIERKSSQCMRSFMQHACEFGALATFSFMMEQNGR